MKQAVIVALIFFVCLTGSRADDIEASDAFQITIGTTIDHTLLVLPRRSQSGETSTFGWHLSVTNEDGHRIYRANRGEKSHATHVLQSTKQNVAFNPVTSRFERLAQNIRVELRDPAALDRIVEAAGGTGGRVYPLLGFALVHLPAHADPVSTATKIQELPEVVNAWLTVRGPKREPRSESPWLESRPIRALLDSPSTTAIAGETLRVGSGSNNVDLVIPTPAITMSRKVSENTSATVATSVNEWQDSSGVILSVNLDSASEEDTTVELRSSGTASLGSDFDLFADGPDGIALDISELSTVELTIGKNEKSASVILRPIRDLEQEGNETVTIDISSVAGNVTDADSSASVDVVINDTGHLMLIENGTEDVAEIVGHLHLSATADAVEIDASLTNLGTIASSATTGRVEVRTSLEDSGNAVLATPNEVEIGVLSPNGESLWEGKFSIALSSLRVSQNYHFAFVVSPAPEEHEFTYEDRAFADMHIGTDGQVRVTCEGFSRNSFVGVADPLLKDQWALNNTGQTEHFEDSGVAAEDLRMTDTLTNGPTGSGITVAIVDSGLEICHPDLESNVETGMSYNFVADLWHGASSDDPFLPSLLDGDHGTSVAGIIAMEANNGIGGRGIAPDVALRGFNLLALEAYQDLHLGGEYDVFARELDSLGMSSSNPRSNDVDIFNMSYGSSVGAIKLGIDKRNMFKAGTEQLRIDDVTGDSLGAIYVLAAGNAFENCAMTPDLYDEKQRALFLNLELGCSGANFDPESAWPYVVAVGAFNADGKRASYSSVGSNLWVVAPGGEDGFTKPAIISTDQMGLDRGYATQDEIEWLRTAEKNPDGDYTYVFGGTSSAAPYAAGAVAVMLSARPELTWRDVKHILAKTARELDPEIRRLRVAFGGTPVVLQHAWTTNAAGYTFHNHYGFGAIVLDKAVAMARSITPNNLGTFVQSDPFEQASSIEIPDHNGTGVTLLQTITGLPTNANIEAVQLRFQITHSRPHDLGLTLISPAGTPSVINHVFNGVLLDHPSESIDWELLSNAFYGESPNGEWQLNVIDAAPDETGRVDSWALVVFYGEHP